MSNETEQTLEENKEKVENLDKGFSDKGVFQLRMGI